jgi:hypothetical protein
VDDAIWAQVEGGKPTADDISKLETAFTDYLTAVEDYVAAAGTLGKYFADGGNANAIGDYKNAQIADVFDSSKISYSHVVNKNSGFKSKEAADTAANTRAGTNKNIDILNKLFSSASITASFTPPLSINPNDWIDALNNILTEEDTDKLAKVILSANDRIY